MNTNSMELSNFHPNQNRRMTMNARPVSGAALWTLSGLILAACGGGGGAGSIPSGDGGGNLALGSRLASNPTRITDTTAAAGSGFDGTIPASAFTGNVLPTVGGTLSAAERAELASGTLVYSAGNFFTGGGLLAGGSLASKGELNYNRSTGEWTFDPHNDLNKYATSTKSTETFGIVIISSSGTNIESVSIDLTYTLPTAPGGLVDQSGISDGDDVALFADDALSLHSGGAITIADRVQTDSDGNAVLEVTMTAATISVHGGTPMEIAGLPQTAFESGTYRVEVEITPDGTAAIVIVDADAPADASRYLLGTLTIDTDSPARSEFVANVAAGQESGAMAGAAIVVNMPIGDTDTPDGDLAPAVQDFA